MECELVPGKLKVTVVKTWPKSREKEIPCWTYVSRGLCRHGQREVVLFLEQAARETTFPREALRLFTAIDQSAADGRLLDAGDVTELRDSPFPGFHLAYVPAVVLPNLPISSTALCAILVTADELKAVGEFGFTRVMTRLGESGRFFPCPFWSDRSRPGNSFAESRQQSVLQKIPRLKVQGAHVNLDGGQVWLRLPRGSGGVLATQLKDFPIEQAVVLLTDFDPVADGCLLWKPGQVEPAAIVSEHSARARLSGCFFLFGINPNHIGAKRLEDGYALSLPPGKAEAFRRAIAREEQFTVLPCASEHPFRMEWYEPKGSADGGLEVYEVFGTFSNADAGRLLKAFVRNDIEFTLDVKRMEIHDLSPTAAAHGGEFGDRAGITIGVQVDDWDRAMIQRQHVLKILA